MAQGRGAQVLGAGITMAGVGLVVGSRQISGDASYAGVGPRSFPLLIGVALAVAGVAFVRAASRGEVGAASPPLSRTPVLWIFGALALAIALLPWIGFPPSVALLFALTARGFGSHRWLRGVLIGLVIGLAIYALFSYGLGVSLPGGPLDRL